MQQNANNKIMKPTLIILSVLLLGCNTYRNATLKSPTRSVGYLSIKELKGDTLSYLNKNFIDNKSNYIGKELNVLLNDLELKIEDCYPSIVPNNRYITPELSLSFETITSAYLKEKNGKKTCRLHIVFEKPMQSDTVHQFMRETNYYGWTDSHKRFFGNQIIKDVRLSAF